MVTSFDYSWVGGTGASQSVILSLGCGGADIGEDADVSGDVGLFGGGEDGLYGGEVKLFVHQRFPRAGRVLCKEFPNRLPFFLYFSRDMFLVSLNRRSGECD